MLALRKRLVKDGFVILDTIEPAATTSLMPDPDQVMLVSAFHIALAHEGHGSLILSLGDKLEATVEVVETDSFDDDE